MKYTLKSAQALAATLITFGSLAGGANGAVIMTVNQIGIDVVASFSGTIDLTGLTHQAGGSAVGVSGFLGVKPALANIAVGGSPTFDPYGANSDAGPSTLGTGSNLISPSSSFGDFFGVTGQYVTYDVWVPRGYVSGSPLSGSSTWLGQTIAGLGLTPGSYVYTWANDSATVNIAVPEPSSALFLGLGALGLMRYRRRIN